MSTDHSHQPLPPSTSASDQTPTLNTLLSKPTNETGAAPGGMSGGPPQHLQAPQAAPHGFASPQQSPVSRGSNSRPESRDRYAATANAVAAGAGVFAGGYPPPVGAEHAGQAQLGSASGAPHQQPPGLPMGPPPQPGAPGVYAPGYPNAPPHGYWPPPHRPPMYGPPMHGAYGYAPGMPHPGQVAYHPGYPPHPMMRAPHMPSQADIVKLPSGPNPLEWAAMQRQKEIPGQPSQSPATSTTDENADEKARMESPSWPNHYQRPPGPPAPSHGMMMQPAAIKMKEPTIVDRLVGPANAANPPEVMPQRRAFFERLVTFCETNGEPITMIPQVSKQNVDLHRLYIAVRNKGGFEQVTKDKAWKAICSEANPEISESSAAGYQLRRHYQKHLLMLECMETQRSPKEVLKFAENLKKKKKPSETTTGPGTPGSGAPTTPLPSTPSSTPSASTASSSGPPQPGAGPPSGSAGPGAGPQGAGMPPGHPWPGHPDAHHQYYYGAGAGAEGRPGWPSPSPGYPPVAYRTPMMRPPHLMGAGQMPDLSHLSEEQRAAYLRQHLQSSSESQFSQPPGTPASANIQNESASRAASTGPAGGASTPDSCSRLSGAEPSERERPGSSASNHAHPPSSSSAAPQQTASVATTAASSSHYGQPPPMYPNGAIRPGAPPQGAAGQGGPQGMRPPMYGPVPSAYPPPHGYPPHPDAYPPHHMQQHPQYMQMWQQQQQQQAAAAAAAAAAAQQRYAQQGGQSAAPSATTSTPSSAAPSVSTAPPSANGASTPQRPHNSTPANHNWQRAAIQGAASPSAPSSNARSKISASSGMAPSVSSSAAYPPSSSTMPPQATALRAPPPTPFAPSVAATAPPSTAAPPPPPQPALFPAGSVEASTMSQRRRPKLLARHLIGVTPRRLVLSLRSGLDTEVVWALNALTAMVFDDSTQGPSLSQMPGLLPCLVDHLAAPLSILWPDQFPLSDEWRKNGAGRLVEWEKETPEEDKEKTVQELLEGASDSVRAMVGCRGERKASGSSPPSTSANFTKVTRTGRKVTFKESTLPQDLKKLVVAQNLVVSGEGTSADDASGSGMSEELPVGSLAERAAASLEAKLQAASALSRSQSRFSLYQTSKSQPEPSASAPVKQETDENAECRFFFRAPTKIEEAEYPNDVELKMERAGALVTRKSEFVAVTERCLAISNLIRGFSFVPGNESALSSHSGLLILLGKFLRLMVEEEEVMRATTTMNDDSVGKAMATPSLLEADDGDNILLQEVATQLREDAFVIISHLSVVLDLYEMDEKVSYPLLDGLLLWAVSACAQATDNLLNGSISPRDYALESLCKLCVLEGNVDLLLSTGSWPRMEKFVKVLVRLLPMHHETHHREFAIVILNALCLGSDAACWVTACDTPAISHLIAFIEAADQNMHQVMQSHGMNALRENPEMMGTSVGMLRRAAAMLAKLTKVQGSGAVFAKQQQRLLQFTMSQLMDSRVAATVAETLFEVQKQLAQAAGKEVEEKKKTFYRREETAKKNGKHEEKIEEEPEEKEEGGDTEKETEECSSSNGEQAPNGRPASVEGEAESNETAEEMKKSEEEEETEEVEGEGETEGESSSLSSPPPASRKRSASSATCILSNGAAKRRRPAENGERGGCYEKELPNGERNKTATPAAPASASSLKMNDSSAMTAVA